MNDDSNRSFVERLNETITRHLSDEQFGVEALAREMGASKTQLHRKLQLHTGKSASQLIRETRLKKGKALLENKDYTVAEVAYQVGFSSPTYFNTSFHNFYGYTPGEVKDRQFQEKRRKAHTPRYIWSSLIMVLFLAIIYFAYLFLPGIRSKSSDPPISQNKSLDAMAAKSIVVIPFEFLGKDSAYNYYSNGMVSEILNHLYKIGDLDIRSDILSRQFANTNLTAREIGEAFDVSYVLTGSVLIAGDVLRITPQLIDTQTNKLLWSESYQRSLSEISEIITIQSDIAMKVALACKASISPETDQLILSIRAPDNNQAYEYYLKGQDYWNSLGDIKLALEMYSRAIEADSLFVQAYASRGSMHAEAYFSKTLDDWMAHDQMARKDIENANKLAPGSYEVKFAQAIYHDAVDRDFEKSISLLNELREYTANRGELYAYIGFNKRRQGKWNEAINQLSRAVELEPFNLLYISNLCWTYIHVHQYEEAIKLANQGLEKAPDYEFFPRIICTAVRKKTGDLKVAMHTAGLREKDFWFNYYKFSRQFEKLIDYVKKEDRSYVHPHYFRPKNHEIALFYHYGGDTVMSKIYADSAIQLLERKLKESPLDYRLGIGLSKMYALLGDREKAISYGEQSTRMLPTEADKFTGLYLETDLVKTYILLEEYEHAMDQIEYLISRPGFLSVGDLWTEPEYYDLRQFPRFHEILRAHQPDSLYQLMVNQEM